MYYDVIMSGFGGQGIQRISQIMAVAAIEKNLHVTYLPSYGVEKRGGRTNVTLVVADEEIGSPVTNRPRNILAMDLIGLQHYQQMTAPGGNIFYNSNLIEPSAVSRDDCISVAVPCNDMAQAAGDARYANMVIFGALLSGCGFLDFRDIEAVMESVTPEHHRDLIPGNLAAMKNGMDLAPGRQ